MGTGGFIRRPARGIFTRRLVFEFFLRFFGALSPNQIHCPSIFDFSSDFSCARRRCAYRYRCRKKSAVGDIVRGREQFLRWLKSRVAMKERVEEHLGRNALKSWLRVAEIVVRSATFDDSTC